MKWISTKQQEVPQTSDDVLVLINESEPVVAYFGEGRHDSDLNKDEKMWRSTIGDYIYPKGLITHFMYISKPNVWEKDNPCISLDLGKTDEATLRNLFDGFARAEVQDGFIITFGGFRGDVITPERVITLTSAPAHV